MKLRIKGNSVRLRLTKSEVDFFGGKGYLEEKTDFGNNYFSYTLKTIPEGNKLTADFSNGTITLFIPQSLANEWTATEKVGYEGEMETRDGKKLFLLIEKDFRCLDNVAEDQSDNYENPLALKL